MKRKEEEVEAACIEFTKLRNRLARHEGVLEKRVRFECNETQQ